MPSHQLTAGLKRSLRHRRLSEHPASSDLVETSESTPTPVPSSRQVTPYEGADSSRGSAAASREAVAVPSRRQSVSGPVLVAAGLLLLAACGVALFAHPAVTTFEIQRGERHAPSGVRVSDQPLAGADDALGRVGFVLIIAGSLAGAAGLQRWSVAANCPTTSRAYLPASVIVGLFAAFAITWWLNSQLLLYSFAPGSFGYVEWLNQATSMSLSRGLENVWTPYPQGTQDLLVGLQLASNTLGTWLGSDIWTPYTLFRGLFQTVFLLVPTIATVYLVYRLGLSLSPAHATVGAMAVAFSFAPVYYGITSTVVTDPLPVALSLLGLVAVVSRRPTLAGLVIGAGGALKLFPILLLPAALIAAKNQAERVRLLLASGIVLLVVMLPAAIANFDIFLSPMRWQTGRPAWETWYALSNWLVSAPHNFTQPYFRDIAVGQAFGWVFWGITPPLDALTSAIPAAAPRWENVVNLLGTLVTLSAFMAAKSTATRSIIRWAGFGVAGVLFWSTGWSPQYELYLVPLLLLAFPEPKLGLVVALALEVVTALEYPLLLPWAYYYGGSGVWLSWGAIAARYVLLAWFCIYVLRHEASGDLLRRRLLRGRVAQ